MRTIMTRRTPTSLVDQFLSEPFFSQCASAECEVAPLALDLSEDQTHVIVRASLPGYTKSEINVAIHEGVLTIAAQHVETTEEKTERFYRRERRLGSLSRRVILPDTVQDQPAAAELRDGVLTLRFAKTPREQPRKIEIA